MSSVLILRSAICVLAFYLASFGLSAADPNDYFKAMPNLGTLKMYPLSINDLFKAPEVDKTASIYILTVIDDPVDYILTGASALAHALGRLQTSPQFYPKWLERTLSDFRSRSSRELRLAGSLALVYHGLIEDYPRALQTLVEDGLTYPNELVRAKVVVALIVSKAVAAQKQLSTHWENLSTSTQDTALKALIEYGRDSGFLLDWLWAIDLFFQHAKAAPAQHDARVVEALQEHLDFLNFADVLSHYPRISASIKQIFLQQENKPGFSSISGITPAIESEQIYLLGAAMQVRRERLPPDHPKA